MRRLVVSALLACCGFAGSYALVDVIWDTTTQLGPLETVEGQGFRIKLPCTPTKETAPMPVPGGGSVTTNTWICEASDSAYAVSMFEFPDGVRINRDGALDGTAQGVAQGVGGTVVSTKNARFSGAPGRDVRIRATWDGEPATSFHRILLHRRMVIHVEVVLLEDDLKKPPATYQKVLKSLTFR